MAGHHKNDSVEVVKAADAATLLPRVEAIEALAEDGPWRGERLLMLLMLMWESYLVHVCFMFISLVFIGVVATVFFVKDQCWQISSFINKLVICRTITCVVSDVSLLKKHHPMSFCLRPSAPC